MNRGGITVYVVFARSPRNRFKAPTVPACAEATKLGNAQHSRIDLPFDAEIAVKFRAEGAKGEGDAAQVEEIEDWASEVLDKSASATSAEQTLAGDFMILVR